MGASAPGTRQPAPQPPFSPHAFLPMRRHSVRHGETLRLATLGTHSHSKRRSKQGMSHDTTARAVHGAVLREPDREREYTGPACHPPPIPLLGQSLALQHIERQVRRLGPTPLTVIIQGETGAGKEVVARALHAWSDRAAHPFIAVY